jgi:serine/threonine protein kinase
MNYYLAMEYFEHGTLLDHLKKSGPRVPENDAKKIVDQLLRGTRIMHSQSYTHRDLKPSVRFRHATVFANVRN